MSPYDALPVHIRWCGFWGLLVGLEEDRAENEGIIFENLSLRLSLRGVLRVLICENLGHIVATVLSRVNLKKEYFFAQEL